MFYSLFALSKVYMYLHCTIFVKDLYLYLCVIICLLEFKTNLCAIRINNQCEKIAHLLKESPVHVSAVTILMYFF